MTQLNQHSQHRQWSQPCQGTRTIQEMYITAILYYSKTAQGKVSQICGIGSVF